LPPSSSSASTVCFGGSTGRTFGCRGEGRPSRGSPAESSSAAFRRAGQAARVVLTRLTRELMR
jgi:hypothetical protein